MQIQRGTRVVSSRASRILRLSGLPAISFRRRSVLSPPTPAMSRLLAAAVVVALCACAAAQSAEEEHETRAQQALADSLTDANAMMEHGSDSAKESAAQVCVKTATTSYKRRVPAFIWTSLNGCTGTRISNCFRIN